MFVEQLSELIKVVKVNEWNEKRACKFLSVRRIPFKRKILLDIEGVLGYATEKSLAVKPNTHRYSEVLLHELAHIVLNHYKQKEIAIKSKASNSAMHLLTHKIEVEAQGTAIVCLKSLNLEITDRSFAYLSQHLYLIERGFKIPSDSLENIKSASNEILNAGILK
jgi:hypothetical protein